MKEFKYVKQQYLIWDLPLRVFHWGLVVALSGLWYTSEQEGEMTELHMQFGYCAIGLVCFRILWGFLGTKHALFTQFVPRPSQFKGYISNKEQTGNKQYAGHNPLGSLMVLLMLFLVLLQATTGLFITDDIFSSGPYYGVLSKGVEDVMATIHHYGFDLITIAIAMHVGAIIYYRVKKGKRLVKPMITGKKTAQDVDKADSIPHSKLLVALLVVAVVVCFVYWLVVFNAPVVEEYYY